MSFAWMCFWLVIIWIVAIGAGAWAWTAYQDAVKRMDRWSEERPRGRDDR